MVLFYDFYRHSVGDLGIICYLDPVNSNSEGTWTVVTRPTAFHLPQGHKARVLQERSSRPGINPSTPIEQESAREKGSGNGFNHSLHWHEIFGFEACAM